MELGSGYLDTIETIKRAAKAEIEEKLKRQGLFNTAFGRALLAEHLPGRADHRKTLWTLFCFQLWSDRWA